MPDAATPVPSPSISEVILKTARFAEMHVWYKQALGFEPFFVRPRADEASWTGANQVAFFRLRGEYPYNQILGLFEVDDTAPDASTDPGLHHFQLAHANLDELFARYDMLKGAGIVPAYMWNHGVMTSFYYLDPDGNQAEMTSTNFPTEEEYLAYFSSDSFKKNISGIEINAEDYIARYRAGMPQSELVKIPD